MAKQKPEEKRRDELIDELLKGYNGPDSFWGESGLFADLKKRIVERILDAEMDNHLGYRKHDPQGNNSGNGRYSLQCVLQDAEVAGIDLNAAVEVAYQNLQGHPHASFVQADMFKLPFRPGTFDMAFSIGVLMHTGDVNKAFTALANHVKPGGHVGIGVYQK